MAKFFKDPNGKLIAALGNDVATPAGCTELTANTEDAAHEKHVPVVVHYLEPGMKPATFFAGGSKTGTVYAYCNLHGLWSATF